MKSKLSRFGCAITSLSVLTISARANAVVLGQVDTFSDGTTDNWGGGGATYISRGGPNGDSDAFLEVVANGGDGPGSKLVTYNRTQWIGDFISAGVTQINVDLKDFGTTSLSMRIAFKDGTGQSASGYVTTNAFILPADGAWHHANFSVTAAAMTAVNSPAESFDSLIGPGGSLAEFRILDSASPSLFGDVVGDNLGIDNVTAASAGPTTASASWNAGSGNWETGADWQGGMPAFGVGQTATFPDPVGNAPASATVTLTANETIGTLAFTAAAGGSYKLASAGGSTLTLSNSAGGSIHLLSTAGNVIVSVPLVFNNAVTITVDGGNTLSLAAGITGTGGLNKTGTGTLAISAPAAGSGITPLTLSSLSITGGLLSVQSASSHGDRTLLMPGNLTVIGGQLDLGGNDAIIEGSSLAAVQSLVRAGYNGGTWNGSGPAITSSLARADTTHLTAIGTISGVTSFDSRTVLSTDVLAKYTYYGDANLDGQVNSSDYSRIDNGFLSRISGWFNGDFNYDGVINGSDYTLIDNAFNTQRAALTAIIASPDRTITEINASNVPEPAMSAAWLTATMGLLARRHQKNDRKPRRKG